MLTLFPHCAATGTSTHRRQKKRVGLAAITAAIFAAGAAGSASADITSNFSIAVFPDTQYYAAQANGGTAQMFYDQTTWVANNRVARNIAFVAGVGDIVDNDADINQWTIANAAYNTLDAIQAGAFPYSAPPGNHDVIPAPPTNMIAYFGNARYAGRSWYGGASPDGLNFYQKFTGGGQQFLSIGVNFHADAAALTWVKSVIAANPGMPTIISTHEDLNEDATGTRSTYGDVLWDEVVKGNNQIFMVLSGHNPGVSRRVSTNLFGNQVHEIMVDYQAQALGGAGFMRLMEFNPTTKTIHTTSFSPNSGGTKTDAANEFDISIDFAARFATPAFSISTKTFQQGVSGYAGAKDTYVRSGQANTSFATTTPLVVDSDVDGVGFPAQSLIKFGNIFIDEGGTVPRGATITQATLKITTGSAANDESDNTLEIRDVTRTWADSDTWNSLTGGINAGEYNATTLWTARGETLGAFVLFDVTASLQAYSAGGANNGWVFLPTNTNGWRWNSSDFATASGRPELSVTYMIAAVPEPGTLAILGAGVAALLWRKRRSP